MSHTNVTSLLPSIITHPDNHSISSLNQQSHQIDEPFDYSCPNYSPIPYDLDDDTNDLIPSELPLTTLDHNESQTTNHQVPPISTYTQNQDPLPSEHLIQHTIPPPTENFPFGDLLSSTKPAGAIRLFFQNVNGIRSYNSWAPWANACNSLNDLQVDIFGIAETNLKWNTRLQETARSICQRHYHSALLSVSSSTDPTRTEYQPGGTATIITNKWTGRSTTSIHDHSGLGRWSGFKLRRNNNKHLNILTIYQPTISTGFQTCYQQHTNILRNKGITSPNPRKQLLSDLTHTINLMNTEGDFTIIMMDANEGLHERGSSLPIFLARNNLIPLIQQSHSYPPSHSKGSYCIDFIFGSPELLPYIQQSGYTSFFEHPWPSTDHRALFLDIDNVGLFGASTHSLLPTTQRRLVSTSRTLVKKFIPQLQDTNALSHLLNELPTLHDTQEWTTNDHASLEAIDQQFTTILLKAEAQCAIPSKYPWSPEIQQASLIYHYWLIHQKGIKHRRNVSHQLHNISQQLSLTTLQQGDSTRSSLAQFRLARKTLIDTQQTSYSKRQDNLHILHETLVNEGKLKKSKALQLRIARERQRQCWASLRTLTKGNKTAGGISHVLIQTTIPSSTTMNQTTMNDNPNATTHQEQSPQHPQPMQTTIQRIQTKNELDNALLNRNIKHFAQAQGTPFTIPPLSTTLGFAGCNDAAQRILNGTIPSNLTKHTKMILTHLQRIRQPMQLSLTFNDMCTGFSKWREQTATSPSNKHLGIYKSLTNARKYNIFTAYEEEQEFEYNQSNQLQQPTAETALQIQYQLMTLAIRECHTYNRWKTVHNFFIEKIPGTPLLDKLRVIHIYEADWSLIQRFYVAHRLSKTASIEGTLTKEQAGGRPGRSSIELACNRTFTYETMRLQRLTGAVMYNDAKACYDRIIENLSNISLLREGLPIEIARLHAQTFQLIKYHIKHRLGIGEKTHSHNDPASISGMGQGSTDASTRWSFLSDALIRAFNDDATDATIHSLLSKLKINNKIAGFVDDTATMLIQHPDMAIFLFLILQKDAQHWEKLLYVSGGKLEIPKCKFAFFKWTFNYLGIATLQPNNNQHIQVTSSEDRKPMIVHQIDPSTAYKYVGVEIALDGNMAQQIKALQLKCNKLNSALSQVYLSPQDTAQGYSTVFTPSIKYVLPATSITRDVLKKMQKPITNTVLTKLGFNRHMPRAVVFAPITLGGLGLLDLYTEQGCSQILLIISHIRAQSHLSETMMCMFESYQVTTGMIHPLFEQNNSNPHFTSSWIDSVRQFLFTIAGKISIPTLTTISTSRVDDIAIMNNPHRKHFSQTQLEAINACRLYLQITTLAEISNDLGTHLLQCAITGETTTAGKPTIWTYSTSTIKWPYQLRPPPVAWKFWKSYLKQFTTQTPSKQLLSPLGDWLPSCRLQRQWTFLQSDNTIFQATTNNTYRVYNSIQTRARKIQTFQFSHHHTGTIQGRVHPIIPIEHNTLQIRASRKTTTQQVNNPVTTLPTSNNSEYTKLHEYILSSQAESTIYIASDGGLLYDKATYGGIINTNDTTIWEIKGSITPQAQLSSLTAEAYGCYYTIDKLFQEIGIVSLKNKHIILICDSKSLLSRLHSLVHYPITPTTCLTPEYEVISSIASLLKQLPSFTLEHIKSHQTGILSHEALLNSKCDELATEARSMRPPTTKIPILPQSRATFTINDSQVSSQYIHQIRSAALSQDLREYYMEKYQWCNNTIDLIQWKCHGRALLSLHGRHQKTMLQFIHKWLPINTSYSLQAIGTGKLCPYCKSCDETHEHFLTCTHPHCNSLWIDEAEQIHQHINQQISDPILLKLLHLAITEWRTQKSPPVPAFIPPAYHQLFKSQSAIGWNQIVNGRFSTDWITIHDQNPATRSTGETWLIITIKALFQSVIRIWKARCNMNHGIDTESKRAQALLRLQPIVQQLYEQKNKLELPDQRIFSKSIDSLLEAPASIIENWIYKAKPLVKQGVHRANTNAKRQHLPIHSFFKTARITTVQTVQNTQLNPDRSTLITNTSHTELEQEPVLSTNEQPRAETRAKQTAATRTKPTVAKGAKPKATKTKSKLTATRPKSIRHHQKSTNRAQQTAARRAQPTAEADINATRAQQPAALRVQPTAEADLPEPRAPQTAATTRKHSKYIPQLLTTFFKKLTTIPEPPNPVIPQPKSDDRPP
jgi:hypothetical protein